ncbi:MAG TPA: tRNA lysidine(34) synthetase TilS [Nitrospiraceae bacterium]|nr:tRNA lysidine(34) synthetase TilS [Nitrospiraceae bacterium]
MTVIEKVKKTVNKYSMLSQGDHVLVGLSGGPDSVCLLTILHRLNEPGVALSAAYIDHGLRPHETPDEIEFCAGICNSMNIEFITRHIDVKSYAKEKGLSKQEAARELRYDALCGMAAEKGANKIALGHNADDQAETVIMRLLRGSGPSGLSGIPPVRILGNRQSSVIRPLLETERIEIETFLGNEGLGFVVDSSNLGHEYLRNRIRHTVIPSIKNINKDFIHTLSRTSDIFRDEERYFDLLTTKTLMKLISRKTGSSIELFSGPLEAMDTVLLRRVLRRAIDETKGLRAIGFVHIEDMLHLIKSGNSGDRIYLPKGIRVIKGYSTLIITSEQPVRLGTYAVKVPGELVLKESSIVVRSAVIDINESESPGDGKNNAFIDADKVNLPLTIRGRSDGDFFYPAGFGKRKKLQDYFVDEKVPRDERDAIPLLISGNDIAWIMGYRTDERYKVAKDTKRVIKFEIRPMKI